MFYHIPLWTQVFWQFNYKLFLLQICAIDSGQCYSAIPHRLRRSRRAVSSSNAFSTFSTYAIASSRWGMDYFMSSEHSVMLFFSNSLFYLYSNLHFIPFLRLCYYIYSNINANLRWLYFVLVYENSLHGIHYLHHGGGCSYITPHFTMTMIKITPGNKSSLFYVLYIVTVTFSLVFRF